jgi:hypothetical protein
MDHRVKLVPRPTLMTCSCGKECEVCNQCGRIMHVDNLRMDGLCLDRERCDAEAPSFRGDVLPIGREGTY